MKKLIIILFQLLVIGSVFAQQQKFTSPQKQNDEIEFHIKRLRAKKNLILPIDEEIRMLKQTYSFDLGKFLITNHKHNGYWRPYALFHAPKQKLNNALEDWYVNKSPRILASRERFYIFQNQVKFYLKNHKDLKSFKIASIPCGMMDDLLTIDYGDVKNIQLVGIDIDASLLKLAENNAQVNNKQNIVTFIQRDAWQLQNQDEFNLIVHHGLILYISDHNKIIELYKKLYDSLKRNGILITAFLNPSPYESKNSLWKNFDRDDAKKEEAFYSDITEIYWKTHTEEVIRNLLERAGFKVLEVIHDSRNILPTIIAQK